MADWNDPRLDQDWDGRDTAIKERDEANARMDYSGESNIPDGTIRWNASAQRFEQWDAGASSWGSLESLYRINVLELQGLTPGNNSGQVPVSNGTRCVDLNADLLDGQQGNFYDDMPNNTHVAFRQASAPTGWVQVTDMNDRVLRVVSGSGGGNIGGQWSITGLTHPHTHRHPHQHETPTRFYNVNDFFQVGSIGNPGFGEGPSRSGRRFGSTENVGSTSQPTALTSQPDDDRTNGASTNSVQSNGNWRPAYVNVIICRRSK